MEMINKVLISLNKWHWMLSERAKGKGKVERESRWCVILAEDKAIQRGYARPKEKTQVKEH